MGIEHTCSACGERNPPGSQFCLFCGVFLGWEEPATSTTAQHATDRPPPGRADTGSGGVRTTAGDAEAGVGATVELPVVSAAPTDEDPVGPALVDCATCRHGNDPARRFCARCGTPLRVTAPPSPPARRPPWWRRLWLRISDPERRASRRAYRRSLPAFYRWRRGILAVLVLLGLGAGVVVAGRNPVQLARNAWHDLRRDVVPVDGVRAAAVPATSVVRGATAAAAVDGDSATAWSTPWKASAATAACGEITGTGRLQLSLPSTRVREIRVVNGVRDPSQRPLQLLPRTLHITTSDGTCLTAELTRSADVQEVRLDTDVTVTSVTITVARTYAATDARAAAVVSLSEVTLMARPG